MSVQEVEQHEVAWDCVQWVVLRTCKNKYILSLALLSVIVMNSWKLMWITKQTLKGCKRFICIIVYYGFKNRNQIVNLTETMRIRVEGK